MGASDLENALETFSALVKSHPDFTEAWNKRATVYFLLGRHHGMFKVPAWRCLSSAPAPPRDAPGGSGRLGTPRVRPGH